MRGVRGFAGAERGASPITQRATSAVAASSARWTVSGCGSVVAAGIVGVAATASRAMCTGEKGSEKEGSSDDAVAAGEEAAAEEEEVPFVTTKSGLQYRDDKVGDGDEAANGMVSEALQAANGGRGKGGAWYSQVAECAHMLCHCTNRL